MSLVLLGLISSLLVQHQVMMRRRSLVTMVRQESMSLEENVIEKVIEFISKCICVFGEACMTCLDRKWFSKLSHGCSYVHEFPGYSILVLPLVMPLSTYFAAP